MLSSEMMSEEKAFVIFVSATVAPVEFFNVYVPPFWEEVKVNTAKFCLLSEMRSSIFPVATTLPPFMEIPRSESIPESILVPQPWATTLPPLITSQPFESMPSPSPVFPSTKILTFPPFIVVTETLSSFVFIPSLPETILMFPPFIVR